jgi:hypothetical protein
MEIRTPTIAHIGCGLGLAFSVASSGLFLSACGATQQSPEPNVVTSNQALAIVSPVINCENRAANRHDDGSSELSAVAQQVMDICTVERLKARMAFHLPPTDPDLDADDFKRSLEVVEDERKSRPKSQNVKLRGGIDVFR